MWIINEDGVRRKDKDTVQDWWVFEDTFWYCIFQGRVEEKLYTFEKQKLNNEKKSMLVLTNACSFVCLDRRPWTAVWCPGTAVDTR